MIWKRKNPNVELEGEMLKRYIAILSLVVLFSACASQPSQWKKEGVKKNADKVYEDLTKEESKH